MKAGYLYLPLCALLAASSCGFPVLERARVKQGLHPTMGVGYAKGSTVEGSLDDLRVVPYQELRAHGALHYGYSPHWAMFIQGGIGLKLLGPVGLNRPDASVGLKYAPTEYFAVKVGTGLPSLFDLMLLLDAGDHVTFSLFGRCFGTAPIAGGGITLHVPVNSRSSSLHLYCGSGGNPWGIALFNAAVGLGF